MVHELYPKYLNHTWVIGHFKEVNEPDRVGSWAGDCGLGKTQLQLFLSEPSQSWVEILRAGSFEFFFFFFWQTTGSCLHATVSGSSCCVAACLKQVASARQSSLQHRTHLGQPGGPIEPHGPTWARAITRKRGLVPSSHKPNPLRLFTGRSSRRVRLTSLGHFLHASPWRCVGWGVSVLFLGHCLNHLWSWQSNLTNNELLQLYINLISSYLLILRFGLRKFWWRIRRGQGFSSSKQDVKLSSKGWAMKSNKKMCGIS